jgi:hypothetical protein
MELGPVTFKVFSNFPFKFIQKEMRREELISSLCRYINAKSARG